MLLLGLILAAPAQEEDWRYPDAKPIRREDLPPPEPVGPPAPAPRPSGEALPLKRIEQDAGLSPTLMAFAAGGTVFGITMLGLLGLRGILRVDPGADPTEPVAAEPGPSVPAAAPPPVPPALAASAAPPPASEPGSPG